MPKINFRNSCFRQCLQIVVAFYLLVLILQLYLVNSSKHSACTFVFVDWNLLNQNEKKLNIIRRLEPELLNLFLVYSLNHILDLLRVVSFRLFIITLKFRLLL